MARGPLAWRPDVVVEQDERKRQRELSKREMRARWCWIDDLVVGDMAVMRSGDSVTVAGRNWVN